MNGKKLRKSFKELTLFLESKRGNVIDKEFMLSCDFELLKFKNSCGILEGLHLDLYQNQGIISINHDTSVYKDFGNRKRNDLIFHLLVSMHLIEQVPSSMMLTEYIDKFIKFYDAFKSCAKSNDSYHIKHTDNLIWNFNQNYFQIFENIKVNRYNHDGGCYVVTSKSNSQIFLWDLSVEYYNKMLNSTDPKDTFKVNSNMDLYKVLLEPKMRDCIIAYKKMRSEIDEMEGLDYLKSNRHQVDILIREFNNTTGHAFLPSLSLNINPKSENYFCLEVVSLQEKLLYLFLEDYYIENKI
ncbi:hypothetical protein BPT24_033 [Tenacibaculum phage pT24]|uniref:Uncharacterized protein n=1 Tax=Tenacibaculum phage pT24 TaxID=1880590 RepID=A0A1B4XWI5_9CAUD|nr:hypothetical protein HYP10_gp033 [Tenacibaculum phage pT24]BAV39155.1 hypothetical protein BPT24_033 [Tenacibaculum phage pT24]